MLNNGFPFRGACVCELDVEVSKMGIQEYYLPLLIAMPLMMPCACCCFFLLSRMTIFGLLALYVPLFGIFLCVSNVNLCKCVTAVCQCTVHWFTSSLCCCWCCCWWCCCTKRHRGMQLTYLPLSTLRYTAYSSNCIDRGCCCMLRDIWSQ